MAIVDSRTGTENRSYKSHQFENSREILKLATNVHVLIYGLFALYNGDVNKPKKPHTLHHE